MYVAKFLSYHHGITGQFSVSGTGIWLILAQFQSFVLGMFCLPLFLGF